MLWCSCQFQPWAPISHGINRDNWAEKKHIAWKRGGGLIFFDNHLLSTWSLPFPHQISVVKVTKCSKKTELCPQMFGSVLWIVMITLLYFRAMRLATKRSKSNVMHNSIWCVCSKSSMTNTDKYKYRMEHRISFSFNWTQKRMEVERYFLARSWKFLRQEFVKRCCFPRIATLHFVFSQIM